MCALSRFFEYALELRAELPQESFTSLRQGFPPNAFLVGFTLVNWRETWDVLPWEPAIHLAPFVHRVDGLAPGSYMLARDPAMVGSLRQAMHQQFDWTSRPVALSRILA